MDPVTMGMELRWTLLLFRALLPTPHTVDLSATKDGVMTSENALR